MKQDLTFDVENISIKPDGYYRMSIDAIEANIDQILSQLKLDDVIAYYGTSEVLQNIGEDACKDEFDLTEKE